MSYSHRSRQRDKANGAVAWDCEKRRGTGTGIHSSQCRARLDVMDDAVIHVVYGYYTGIKWTHPLLCGRPDSTRKEVFIAKYGLKCFHYFDGKIPGGKCPREGIVQAGKSEGKGPGGTCPGGRAPDTDSYTFSNISYCIDIRQKKTTLYSHEI